MDKLNYCIDKLEELERKFNGFSSSFKLSLPCREFSYTDSSNDLSLGKTIVSEEFSSKVSSSLLLMCAFDITAIVDDMFSFTILYDGFEILSETKTLTSGVHSLFFMKAVESLSSEAKSFTLRIEPQGLNAHTIDNIKYYVWGDIDASERYVMTSVTQMDGKYAVGMVLNNRLLIAEYNSLPTVIHLSDFIYFKDSVYASISYFKLNGELKLGYARKPENSNSGYFGYKGGSEEVFDSANKLGRVASYSGEDNAIIVGMTNQNRFYYLTYSGKLNKPLTYISMPAGISVLDYEIISNNIDRLIILITTTDGYSYLLRSNKFLSEDNEKVSVKLTATITERTL